MTNPCAAMGVYGRLLVQGGSKPRTFSNTSQRLAIISESIIRMQPFQGRRQITGALGVSASAIRPHSYLVSGVVVVQVGPEHLHQWLPRAMWVPALTNTGTDTYALGLDSSAYIIDMLIDRENALFRYTDMNVARVVIRSQTEGGQQPQNEELLEAMIYFYAIEEQIDEETWPDPEPALVIAGSSLPYAHWEGKLYLGGYSGVGVDTPYRSIQLSIDNNLQPIWNNSISPSCFRSAGRFITLGFDTSFTPQTIDDAEDLLLGDAPAEWLLTHTGGPMSTSFKFPAVRNNYKTPTIRSKGEVPLEFNLEALFTTANNEMVVVNDHNNAA